jgi:hypothetical protein
VPQPGLQQAVSLTECFRSGSGSPTSLPLSRYEVCFSEAKAARGMKLTTRLNLVPTLRTSKPWTLILHMSWRRTQGQLTPFPAGTGPWQFCCYCCGVLGNCLPSASKLDASRIVQIATWISSVSSHNFQQSELADIWINIYICKIYVFGLMVPQPLVGQDLLYEVSRSHTTTHNTR